MAVSSLSWTTRILIIGFGTIVLFAGLVARGLEEELGGSTPGEFVDHGDGTASIYDLPGSGQRNHETQEIDETTSAVFAFDADTGAPVEVFRGTHEEAEAWMAEADPGSRVLVFEGTREAALAWSQARTDESKDLLIQGLIIIAGGTIIVLGLAVGWRRDSVSAGRHTDRQRVQK